MAQKPWFPETLRGSRVVLRRHVPENLAAFHRWYADPEIARLARYQATPMRPEEIERFFAARVVGPDALAMAVHELASNAAKYGGLSTTTGRLSVAWEILLGVGSPALTLTWAETSGPAVLAPTRRGFGTTLIERALAHELDAEVDRQFLAGGLLCVISVPLTEEVGRVQQADVGEAA